MKFIHLTDPHLVSPGEPLHGLDPAARLEACVSVIAARHADASFCVLTGDLADAGEPAAYAFAAEALAALPMPVHLIPGNHDARDAFTAGLPQVPRDENGFVQHAFRAGDASFVLLDTLEPTRGSGGDLCERRLAWLAARLREAGVGPAYLFMHHPPFEIGIPALDAIALADPAPFTRVVEAAGNVRHIFFGHAHRPISGNWRGISFSTLYATSHQTKLDLYTPGSCQYTAEPPAYCVVLLDGDTLVIHTEHFLEDDSDIRASEPSGGQTA